MTQRLVMLDSSPWIEDEVSFNGTVFRTAACPADWKWKTAQPGDIWEPKPRKAGKEIDYRDAMGRARSMSCDYLTIMQHHNADKAAMVRDSGGRIRMIKWASLKRYWRPTTERQLPRKAAR